MSERKGGAHKAERKSVKIDPDVHAELVRYAQSQGIKINIILAEFIEKGVKHDIHDPDWIEKLKKAQRDIDGYASTGVCEGFAPGKDKDGAELYSCVWYRKGRPPQIRILGIKTLQEGRCAACGRTEEIWLGFKERDLRILELETELGSKSSERLKIPKCNRGAVLHHDAEDQLIFKNCFRHPGEPVSINKFCRIQARGLPCSMFAELVVGVEGTA